MGVDVMTWEEAYSLLESAKTGSEIRAMCAAITRLGKPYNREQVRRAAPLVLRFLHHENHLVRYEAIWFLGCWGKLHEYLRYIIEAAESDADMDNRAFAANCAGQVLTLHRDAEATNALIRMVTAEDEEPEVKIGAYCGLLYAFYGKDAWNQVREFEPLGGKSVQDFNLDWLGSLPRWIEGFPATAS